MTSSPQIAACTSALRAAGIAVEDAKGPVARKSRDFYWYSPILKRQLADVIGDFVATPTDVDQIKTILALCHAHGVPVTPRGAGTGNYGQAMPLRGGCILHTAALDQIITLGPNRLIAQPGAIMADLEAACRAQGKEIRLFPSTTATATLGGFIAGGSSGVGAIRWGGLRNPANINRLKLITMEETPREITLTGQDVYKAAHAYGVNGVITEIEIPIDPATDWAEAIIGLPTLAAATQFALDLGAAHDAILTRMISVFEAPIPDRFFLRHREHLDPAQAAVAVLVKRTDLPALAKFARPASGALRYDGQPSSRKPPPIYEIGWNHTTLRAMKVDPTITYLQMMLPAADPIAGLHAIKARFGDEILIHLELTRIMGKVTAVALPLVQFTTEARLEEMIHILEAEIGATVFNPHRVTLEEGGMKEPDQTQLAFKRETDPDGLLNPGKMIAWEDPNWKPTAGRSYLFGATADVKEPSL
ncbi:MAG: FAD-binding oxidoreductase [Sulfitobacter sp.]